MATTVEVGWLHDKNGDKFAPKTLISQVQTSDGVLLEDKLKADLDEAMNVLESVIDTKANASDIPTKTSQLTNDSGFKTTDNNTTYTLTKSGSTIILTGSDGTTTSVSDSDTTTTVVNNLTSTSTSSALSAYQGKLLNDKISAINTNMEDLGAGDMLKSVYDTDGDGIVDNAEKVNGFTVGVSVPANAKFTDTVYTHPSSHPASMITGLATVATSGSYNDLTDKPASTSSPAPWTYVYDSDGDVLNLERSVSSYSKTIAPTPYKVEATTDLTNEAYAYGDTDNTIYAEMPTSTTAQTATIYIDTQLPSDASVSSMSISFKIGTSNISSAVWTTRSYTVKCGGNTLGSGSFTLRTTGYVTTVTVSDVSKLVSPIIEIAVQAKTTTEQAVRIYGAQVDATYTSSKECVPLIRQTSPAVGDHSHGEIYALVGDIESALAAL